MEYIRSGVTYFSGWCMIWLTQESRILLMCHWWHWKLSVVMTVGHWWHWTEVVITNPCADNDDNSQTARFMGPTWDPPGAHRTQVSPMLAPWNLLSGNFHFSVFVWSLLRNRKVWSSLQLLWWRTRLSKWQSPKTPVMTKRAKMTSPPFQKEMTLCTCLLQWPTSQLLADGEKRPKAAPSSHRGLFSNGLRHLSRITWRLVSLCHQGDEPHDILWSH